MEFVIAMFPNLDIGVIKDVYLAQKEDVDKTIDELLTIAVGDDIFARSTYIEEKLSASQGLRNFESEQQKLLNQYQVQKEKEEKKLEKEKKIEKERKKKQEEETQRKLKQVQLKLELEKAEQIKKQTKEERLKLEKEKKELAEEKRKIQEEKERIENEKALLEEIKSAAKISIYTRNQQKVEGIDQDKIVNEIKNLLTTNGIKENEISLNDVSSDMELASFLKEICKQDEIQYPLVCASNLPIGGINRLKSLIENKNRWENVISGEYIPEFLTEEQTKSLKDGTGVFVGQGVFDHCLDAAEYVISSVSTLLWLPVSIVTYPFRSEKEKLQKGCSDVDFDIVHTNWYWRNLKRRFRFTKEAILRIHPTLNDIRASHMYTSIEIVRIVNDNSIVISYKDGSSPDYVNGTKEVISSMIKLIELRSEKLGAKIIFLREAEM